MDKKIVLLLVSMFIFIVVQMIGVSAVDNCTDTDVNSQFPDGQNIYEKGTVIVVGSNYNYTDVCYDDYYYGGTLYEYYCENSQRKTAYYTCECYDDGSCKNLSIHTHINASYLSNDSSNPSYFNIYDGSGYFDEEFRVYNLNNKTIDDIYLTEGGCYDNKYGEFEGSYCNYWQSSYQSRDYITCNVTINESFHEYDYLIDVAACAKIDGEWYRSPVYFLKVNFIGDSCYDSDKDSQYPDGKNYYEGGYIKNLKTGYVYQDSCYFDSYLGTSRLTERYCDNGTTKYEYISCDCENNACLPQGHMSIKTVGLSENSSNPTVMNYTSPTYIHNNITILNLNGTVEDYYIADYSASCSDSKYSMADNTSCTNYGSGYIGCYIMFGDDFSSFDTTLRYYGCVKVDGEWYVSPAGYLMVLYGDQRCYDSDGDSDNPYLEKGYILDLKYNYNYSDSCSYDSYTGRTRLNERYCDDNGVLRYEYIDCPCNDGACNVTCQDSDETSGTPNGRNYFEKGYAELSTNPGIRYADVCSYNSVTKQYSMLENYCEYGEMKTDTISCVCYNGSCINECYDSDNSTGYPTGLNFYEGGYVVTEDYPGTKYEDSCSNEYMGLTEYYCSNGNMRSRFEYCICADNTSCMDLRNATCIDSDRNNAYPDGKNYFVSGNVTDTRYGYTYNDSCSYNSYTNKSTLSERYCDENGYVKYEYIDCECQDGKCVDPCFDSDVDDYTYPEGKNYYKAGYTVDPRYSNYKTEDSCYTDSYGNSKLYERYCDANGNQRYELIECECEDGACVQDCFDSDTDKYYFPDGKNYYKEGFVINGLYPYYKYVDTCSYNSYSDKYTLQERYCDDSDRVKYENVDCECEGGACNQTCYDSDLDYNFPDGLNYYTKGFVLRYPGTSKNEDYCSYDNSSLKERYCDDNGYVKYKTINCECNDGACNQTCYDSDVDYSHPDGINYNIKGFVILASYPTYKYEDTCSYSSYTSKYTLTERYCDEDGRVKYNSTTCNVCNDGACVDTSYQTYIKTPLLSEDIANPTRVNYTGYMVVKDDIEIFNRNYYDPVEDYYLSDYWGYCNDQKSSEAQNTKCSYTNSSTIDCSITLDEDFTYFDWTMKFFGCAKIAGKWYNSAGGYLIVEYAGDLCYDSDRNSQYPDGKNFYEAGYVVDLKYDTNYSDSCSYNYYTGMHTLRERYCDGYGKARYVYTDCACKDSACVNLTEATHIKTIGLSEDRYNPTYLNYSSSVNIADNIKVYNLDNKFIEDYYLASYTGVCDDNKYSEAENTQCSYTSGDTISCNIHLSDDFNSFDYPLRYYGCAKIDGEWYNSPAEYLYVKYVGPLCYDSDVTSEYPDGKNYYEAGYVENLKYGYNYSDYCSYSSYTGKYRLLERYCDDNGYLRYAYFDCECNDNACIDMNTDTYIRTLGLSENNYEPTNITYYPGVSIDDDIMVHNLGSHVIEDFYMVDYSGICDDRKYYEADNTNCTRSYYQSNKIDCTINLDSDFSYFNYVMRFYGCAKIDGKWYNSPAEYLKVIDNRVNINSCQKLDKSGATYYLTNSLTDVGEIDSKGCFVITADKVTLDCQGKRIIGSSGTNGIYIGADADYATVKNCGVSITDGTGIKIDSEYSYTQTGTYTNGSNYNIYWNRGPTNVHIHDNTLMSNMYGIVVRPTDYARNIIEDNTISYNTKDGIHQKTADLGYADSDANTYYKSYSTIKSNELSYNGDAGYYNYRSEGDTIIDNTISYNDVGIKSEGYSSQFKIESNEITYNKDNGVDFNQVSYYTLQKNMVSFNGHNGFHSWSFVSGTVDDNVFNSNGEYGINYSGTGTKFNDNIACDNEHSDFYCTILSASGSSSASGSGNMFSYVRSCSNGWPSGYDYSICTSGFDNTPPEISYFINTVNSNQVNLTIIAKDHDSYVDEITLSYGSINSTDKIEDSFDCSPRENCVISQIISLNQGYGAYRFEMKASNRDSIWSKSLYAYYTAEAPVTGLNVTSNTPDAYIWIKPSESNIVTWDYIGKTPAVVELDAGTYDIRLTKYGYYDYNQTGINTFTGLLISVDGELLEVPGDDQKISIYSTPVGADIFVDNEYRGQTPKLIGNLSVGKHLTKLTKEGYSDWTDSRYINEGQVVSYSVVLRKME